MTTSTHLIFLEFSIQAKNVQVGCNRRKGRPQLTASALGYQLNEVESVLSDTASESENLSKKATKRKKKSQEVESESDFDIFEDNVEKEPIKPTKSKIIIVKKKNLPNRKSPRIN